MGTALTVNVKLFAGLQGLVGRSDLQVDIPSGTTAQQLRELIAEEYPVLESFMGTLVLAVGEEIVPGEHVLSEGERVDLIPPIQGG